MFVDVVVVFVVVVVVEDDISSEQTTPAAYPVLQVDPTVFVHWSRLSKKKWFKCKHPVNTELV